MNEWVWSIGGMILTGETEVLGGKHYTTLVVDEWMLIEHWWNDTDRGNWITGRKTLYSVGGRWMNEYGALVEWYWQGKLKCWEKNTYQCHFFHHIPQTHHPRDGTVSLLSDVGHSMTPKCLDGNVEGMLEMRRVEKTLVQNFEMKETFESLTHSRNIILKCIILDIICWQCQ